MAVNVGNSKDLGEPSESARGFAVRSGKAKVYRVIAIKTLSVFMDYDIQPTIDYFNWLGSSPEIANLLMRSDCKTKATRGPSSLMCPKCGNINVISVAQYVEKISVYDNNDQAVFALLGDAGRKTQTIIVTKVLSPAVLPPVASSDENPLAPTSEVALLSANDVCASSKACGSLAAEGDKSTCNSEEPKKAKHSKHGE
ncbi:hypothetical protein F2Q69_00015919 [Brassica cretica]|uniref:Replication factor A C-terminal domain-containing protein n=1 Tax=Brassica cretica TaxID=69181 RepID=A0A8S9QSK4_BRACR|nr:hypothetical protein F2Q69_00015919 [Brassica cretica]